MQILLVITKGEMGGAQVFIATLAKTLHKKGHRVTVACGEGNYLRDTLSPQGISVVRFNSLRRTKNPLTNLRFGWDLRNFLTTRSFDAVHFNSSNALFGVLTARMLRRRPKLVFTLHGLSVIDPNYATSPVAKHAYRLFFKLLLLLVDEAVFVNKANFDYAKQAGLLKHGVVIPNGIDTHTLQFLSRDEARAELAKRIGTDISGNYIIGSIGRLAYPKNYEFLINAFPKILKEVPNAAAVIISTGPKLETYKKLIAQNGLTNDIFLAGEIPDARQYIKAFDLFTLPSEYEGVSITLIEAMFAEVPILASHVGGTPELLDDQRQTYALNDAKDYIKKLKAIRASAFTYTEAMRTRRATFDGERMTEQYEKIYG